MLGFDNLVAQTGTIGNKNFQLFLFFLNIFVQQLIVRIQTCLSFGLTCLRCHTYPFKLTFQGLTALAGCFFFHLHTFGLLLQPTGIISFPGNTLTTVQFKNPSGDMIQEIAVVCYGYDGTFVLLQMLFKPIYRFCIQMVGRLIQQQYIGFLKQQTAKSHATALTSRKVFDRLVFGRTTQGIHSTLQTAVQIPCIRSINNVLQFCLAGKKLIHFFGIFIILRQTELLVYFFIFSQCVYNGLYTFHYNLLNRFGRIEIRFLG